ncbi:MAG: UDP-N-acetylenolpyruvoylglucosamine reductase [Bacteroidota bacterium]|jgi:UDP-N-acetylmuramate dehydrogenase
MDVKHDFPLTGLNSFGIAVNAALFISLRNEAELPEIFNEYTRENRPILVMGGGSNILFTKDFNGLVIHNEIEGIACLEETADYVLVKAGAGVNWHHFVMQCVDKGWGGIENLSLIPGTVGAAPVQNIGAYGVELADTLFSLRAWDIAEKCFVEFTAEQCEFGYRQSIFKQKLSGRMVIVSATFRLSKTPGLQLGYGAIQDWLNQQNIAFPTIKDVSNAVMAIRRSKLPDPKVLGNAGSFFKNPWVSDDFFQQLKKNYPEIVAFPEQGGFKLAAGWLIEQCGWKGFRDGDAGCHYRQALVLVNYRGASGKNIVDLAMRIQESVQTKFGVTLMPEVNII